MERLDLESVWSRPEPLLPVSESPCKQLPLKSEANDGRRQTERALMGIVPIRQTGVINRPEGPL